MAAPVAGKILLPSDTGNTGKNVRTQTRVVGADTVHEHFFVPASERSKLGRFAGHSGNLTVQAAAQTGAATGFLWLINPVGSSVKLGVRKVNVQANLATLLSTPTVPRLLMSLVTFTGVASGATISPAKYDSTGVAPVGSLRTAATGLTITVGAAIRSALAPFSGGTAGWTFLQSLDEDWEFMAGDDGSLVLRAGEGIAFWQPDAGTAADTRRWLIDLIWEEFE